MQSLSEIADEIDENVVFEALVSQASDASLIDSADAIAEAAGMKPIGDAWRKLQPSEVPAEILSYLIGHDLAHSGSQLVPLERCRLLSEALLAQADTDAIWLTNVSTTEFCRGGSQSYGSTSVSDWTFDMSLVAVGSAKTLFLCFLAED